MQFKVGETIKRLFPRGGVGVTPGTMTPAPPPRTTGESGRFPSALQHRPVITNPYKPDVEANSFPSVPMARKAFMPPTIAPQMIIRQGAIPHPVGTTVPLVAVHDIAPRRVKR